MSLLFEIFIASFIVSLFAFSGAVLFFLKKKSLDLYLIYVVAFAAGTLLGGAFFHLIPNGFEELIKKSGEISYGSLFILFGILVMYFIEKFLHWHHHHDLECKSHIVSKLSLIGGSFHRLIDGFLIGSSFLGNYFLGITITLLIIIHKIPMEIGNVALLLRGKFSKRKALIYNYLAGFSTVIGAIFAYFLLNGLENIAYLFVLFTAGSFIYISLSDIIPELHKHNLNVILLNSFLVIGLIVSYLFKFIL